MSYSIKAILHNHVHKNGFQSIKIQVIYYRKKIYFGTDYKVKSENFENGQVKGTTSAKQINFNLKSRIVEIESRLLNAIKDGPVYSNKELKRICEGVVYSVQMRVDDWVNEILRMYKLSYGRMKHYGSIVHKLNQFRTGITLSEMNAKCLQEFETYLRKTNIDNNTIQANMQLVKSILNKAVNAELIDGKIFKAYKNVKYIQKIPDYLTQKEVDVFTECVKTLPENNYKKAGLFFLLSCYTGYRISDLMLYEKNRVVKEDSIIIRAKKNNQIVSMLVYPKLQEIIDLIGHNKLEMAENTMRNYVKSLAMISGLGRKIKIHTGRHTFGMMLAANGFSEEEAAELMGDSVSVVRVYYRISNPKLREKIRKNLF